MPMITLPENETRPETESWYEIEGPAGAPVLVFAHSLGSSGRMFDPQVAALSASVRCLRYDLRGHGRSPACGAPLSIEDLSGDLEHLLRALGLDRVDIVGLSLGGMVAQAFAARRSGRVRRLVLMSTGAQMPPRTLWDARAESARRDGMAALVDPTMQRWFTPAFRDAPEVKAVRRQFLATDPAGFAAACGAIRDMDLRDRLPAIAAPTLVVAGAQDTATPPDRAMAIRDAVPDAELVILPQAAHALNVEQAHRVNRHLAAFLLDRGDDT